MPPGSAQSASTPPWTSRPYRDELDLLQMQDLLMTARADRRLALCPYRRLVFWCFMLTCQLNTQEHIRLWHDGAGRLVAYARLGEDPSFDVQVLPAYTGCGIEEDALAWAEARLRELRDHASTLYGDKRALKFCMQRAVPSQICSQRLYDSLSVLLTIPTVLASDSLFGDKGSGVMVIGL